MTLIYWAKHLYEVKKLHGIQNRVLLALMLLLVLAANQLAFLRHAPNRLLSGKSIALSDLLHGTHLLLLVPALALLLLAFMPPLKRNLIASLLLAELLALGLSILAGQTAAELATSTSRLARTSLGGGFWACIMLLLLIAIDAITRLTSSHSWRIILNLQLILPLSLLLLSGRLDELSLLKEYSHRQDVFNAALWQHLAILLGTLLPALLVGVPLGIGCYRHAHFQAMLFPVLNIIQTIPSIAMFSLLLAPLAGLTSLLPWLTRYGISGIGAAPAIIALVLYSLLPLVRSIVAGLDSVPTTALEAARGMGMTRRQMLLQVQIPIALPVILTGIRIVAVQTVGMAVVAALIGAGGFGALVFQGLLSSALDLALLGVIPVVLLAALVDGLFKFIVSLLETVRQ